MKNNKMPKTSRIVATFLAVCMIFQIFIFAPTAHAEVLAAPLTANQAVPAPVALSSSEKHGYVSINGINIEHLAELTDNNNGTFHLELELKTTYSEIEKSESLTSAHNGVYPITHDGFYLIQLWGGKGASVPSAGQGGDEGYIYAKVYLKKGQTLFYTLGGNGTATNKIGKGGGVNAGGPRGIVGGATAGGGGGYSALFLYDVDEPVDRHKSTISEADRISKYLMIAGGGGGGGATPERGTVTGTADGGAGGRMGDASDTVYGDGIIAGTYFFGSNGKSAGTSTSYVGRGASYAPGATINSAASLTDARSVIPDDWFGSYSGVGGAGGTGELRGGGGGAGYAGGSGGIMTSVLYASNVGGGGGGSSFIASEINGELLSFNDLTPEEKDLLVSQNPSETGGAVIITYLPSENESASFLDDLSLEWCLSPYITFLAGSLHMEDKSASPEVEFGWELHNGEANHEKITLSKISLLDKDGNVGGSFNLSFDFLHSAGFIGGNNVPLFRDGTGEEYDCPFTLLATVGSNTHKAFIELGEDCGHVNMPLRIEAHSHDQESNSAGTPFAMARILYDHYIEVRENLKRPEKFYSYEYDYIEAIDHYLVRNHSGEEIFNGAEDDPETVIVYPNATTNYTVVLPVKLKEPVTYAKVGAPIVPDEKGYVYFTDTCTITIPDSRSDQLGKFAIVHTKNLTTFEENGKTYYDYKIDISSNTSLEHNITIENTPGLTHKPNFNTDNADGYKHTIEVTGWYLIQLWGGDGSKGSSSATGITQGGNGGKGGYLAGYVHLRKGDIIEIFMGVNGEELTGGWLTAGHPGKHSRASIQREVSEGVYEKEILMIAGGGGSGGYGLLWDTGEEGASVAETYSTTLQDISNNYASYDGKRNSSTSGGSAGSNYINTELVSPLSWTADSVISENFVRDNLPPSLQETFKAVADNEANAMHEYENAHAGGGTCYVECKEITDDGSAEVLQDLDKALTDFAIFATVTKYFKLEDIFYENLDEEYYADPQTEFDFPTESYNYVLGSDNLLTIMGIFPVVLSNEVEGNIFKASTEFSVTLRFTPSENFMGGNDVPLFTDGVSLRHKQYERDPQTNNPVPIEPRPQIILGANDATDYVNVKINCEAPELQLNPQFYHVGEEPGVLVDDLYTLGGHFHDTIPNGYEWCYDFVDIVHTIWDTENETEVQKGQYLKPDKTTEYDITVGIVPRPALLATKIEPQSEKTTKDSAIIVVGHEVKFELVGLQHDMPALHGKYVVEAGEDLSVRLSVVNTEKNDYPSHITVLIGENEFTDYTYYPREGLITISVEDITDTVTILATASNKSYRIHFVYGETPDATEWKQVQELYEAGASIEGAFHSHPSLHPSVEGYDFSWDWGEVYDEAPTVMPETDLWVFGVFTPQVYKVTVHYQIELAEGDTVEAPEDVILDVEYGKDYSIPSPEINHYLPYIEDTVTPTVQGTMQTSNIEFTVTYKPVLNSVSVIYRYAKTGEQIGEVEIYEAVGGSYSGIEVKTLDGYTQSRDGLVADKSFTEISGSLDGGNIVTVYYIPNVYTVSFQLDGKTLETREVTYKEMYGYLANGDYKAFDIPAKMHYTFMGWYLDDTLIDEESLVSTASNHTLVARMEADIFTVTVKYQFEDGSEVFPQDREEFKYGDSYSFVPRELPGYEPSPAIVEGTVPGQNVLVIVTYTSIYPTEPQIAVEITWHGELSFSYKRGRWDPETHTYGEPSLVPKYDEANKVTVTNVDSHIYEDAVKHPIDIVASYSYNVGAEYEDISVYYTEENSSTSEHITTATIGVGDHKDTYIWLGGEFLPVGAGNYNIGACIINIRAGGIQQ